MGGFDGGMMEGWGVFGWLWMLIPILFWGGLLAAIVWAVARISPIRRTEGRSEIQERRTDSAEETLRARFARGEIEAEEYERSLETLRGETQSNKEPNLH